MFEETVNNGSEKIFPGCGVVFYCPPLPWLVMRAQYRCCYLFLIYIYIYIYSFENPWRLSASVSRSSVTGLEWGFQGPHMLRPQRGFLPIKHINNCWYWWCSHLQIVSKGNCKVLWIDFWTKNEGELKVFLCYWIWEWVEKFYRNWETTGEFFFTFVSIPFTHTFYK